MCQNITIKQKIALLFIKIKKWKIRKWNLNSTHFSILENATVDAL